MSSSLHPMADEPPPEERKLPVKSFADLPEIHSSVESVLGRILGVF